MRELAGRVPIFGVCLGLQAMAVAYGATVGRAPELLHGKTSLVEHDGAGVLAGLPNPFTATRYHSLAVDASTVPADWDVTGGRRPASSWRCGTATLPVEGVQFHPESVLTEGGHLMLANWLAVCGDAGAVARSAGAGPRRPGAWLSAAGATGGCRRRCRCWSWCHSGWEWQCRRGRLRRSLGDSDAPRWFRGERCCPRPATAR